MGTTEAEHDYDLHDNVDGDDDGNDGDAVKGGPGRVPVGYLRGKGGAGS